MQLHSKRKANLNFNGIAVSADNDIYIPCFEGECYLNFNSFQKVRTVKCTTSFAENNQWMKLISEGRAYADTDKF